MAAEDRGEHQNPGTRPMEEVLPSPQLLAHYKARVAEFEAEREELLRAVARCAVQADDLHRLEWEARKRADEVRELQQALGDSQQFLFEERQRLLALQAENDELRLQELEDRRRMQHLLSVAAPLEQAVTLRADAPPLAATAGAAAAAAAGHRQGGGRDGGGGVMRTVFLPAANADALVLKIEALQAQLNEQRALSEERTEALLVDRRVRQQEEERHRANFLVQIEALSTKVAQLEGTLRDTTRDYIQARAAQQAAEERAAAAEARMEQQVKAAQSEAARAQRVARHEARQESSAAEAKMREYVARFREQVRARDEELSRLSALHASTKDAADRRIAELEARVARLSEANRQLETRRQLEADGWAADVTLLRKQLAAVDRKLLQMRLIDRLDDDERLDALLDQLQKRAPAVPPARKQPRAAAAPRGAGGAGPAADAPALGCEEWEGSRDGGGCGGGDEDDTASGARSVTGQLASEVRAVRRQLEELGRRAEAKAERQGVVARQHGAPRAVRGA
ncbi:hypothetical protein Rsub_12466 [Raphidocelis subcapitata]|uniref:Uncharacterized protein n=1 Tax=Raphidocelis subcapitata TaxID=307507 RepID=A0A2V0PP36_9CHLO|nr:hypothetical protein Rsub_12466 [Raphidocelis subcapitata]|eukprot:GBF99207.1 hypothetical protein Rsub_12466 [Raphidocelis subcapitata]